MCGIAGYVDRRGAPVNASVIARMTDAVQHRGPNGSDYFQEAFCAFGHRRLSVLDLSALGGQPMTSQDGRATIVFNGEIYNYIEIRDALKKEGYSFKSGTDTEVLLNAYLHWGRSCVDRLNGMWAFAIFDRIKDEVFISRDRFGVKPIYYILNDAAFAFGSEIRQLLPFLSVRAAERTLVEEFLLTNSMDADERTFFRGILRLPAGHSAVYDLKAQELTIFRYYSVRQDVDLTSATHVELIEEFRRILWDSIKLRMRSDVKVGTCLSGGLDSSSVATIASKLYSATGGGAFSAITAVSELVSSDESAYAGRVVERNGLEWHRVKPSYDDFVTCLPSVVSAQEEPFGSPSLIMQYLVMDTAKRQGITVLLDGQGGDEVLLGYEKYYAAYAYAIWRNGGFVSLLRALSRVRSNNDNMTFSNILKYVAGGLSAKARYRVHKREHPYLKSFPQIPSHVSDFSAASRDPFEIQKLEITQTNLPILLRYEDKNSMHHGIEARLPFLDYRLVQFGLSVPLSAKINDGWTKWLLRKAMDQDMDHEIVWRKNKFGFEAPDSVWLNRHADHIEEAVLSSRLIAEVSDHKKLRAVFPRMSLRTRWRLYSLALWEASFDIEALI